MGLNGYKRLLREREEMVESFSQRLESVAKKHGERLLSCQSNTISFGITLDGLARKPPPQTEGENEKNNDDEDYLKSIAREISSFGAMLFSRCVSGTRVIPRGEVKKMGDYKFVGFGSSTTHYRHAYMTAACAIGVSQQELDEFFIRLDKTLTEFDSKKKKNKEASDE
eukprot:scaffold24419_cov196-Cylindrotheca_fusiformis.AAC.3